MRKTVIFRVLSTVLALMLLLTACGDNSSDDISSNSDSKGQPAANNVTKPEKRNVKYPETYSVVDEIEYNTENVLGSAQIKDKLFILEEDGIHIVDLASGEASHVLEKEGLLNLCADDNNAYTYDNEGVIYTLDISGNIVAENQVLKGEVPDNVFDPPHNYRRDYFISTDDYLVLSYRDIEVGYTHAYISKSDMSIRISGSDRKSSIIFSGEGNEYFIKTDNPYGGCFITGYDIDKDKKGNQYQLDSIEDFAYDKYSKCFITFGGGISDYGMSMTEIDSDNSTCTNLTIFPLFGRVETDIDIVLASMNDPRCERLTVYGNIYCAVSNNLGKIVTYDTQKEQRTLNIAMKKETIGGEALFLAAVLKDKYGINVVVNGYDSDVIALKLMAGDDDIDIFNPGVLIDIPYLVKSSCFVDLNEFDVLKDNINACKGLLDNCFSYNGRIFGIPFNDINNKLITDCSQLEEHFVGYVANNRWAYAAKYFDLVENKYTDDNGKMLYELLKHVYDNKPDENDKDTTYWNWYDPSVMESLCKDVYTVRYNCYMMNPAAGNKEEAALFMDELMNMSMGKTPLSGELERWGIDYYDLDFDYSKCYPLWKSMNSETMFAIADAIQEAYNAKSLNEVKSISKDYYKKIRQIIME